MTARTNLLPAVSNLTRNVRACWAAPAAAPPHFLSVGRFVAKKGPLQTLEAFALAARGRPRLRLVMVGEGPLLDACRDRAVALGIADRVDFAGVRSPQWIAAEMRTMRGFGGLVTFQVKDADIRQTAAVVFTVVSVGP